MGKPCCGEAASCSCLFDLQEKEMFWQSYLTFQASVGISSPTQAWGVISIPVPQNKICRGLKRALQKYNKELKEIVQMCVTLIFIMVSCY